MRYGRHREDPAEEPLAHGRGRHGMRLGGRGVGRGGDGHAGGHGAGHAGGHGAGQGEGHRGRGGGRRGAGRLFDYGELRLLLLAMIAEQPRHGYELMKLIEDRFGGSYTPSPGVIYPTLAWLDDMGYAAIAPQEGGRKLYSVTPEGEAFLTANRAAADALMTRSGRGGAEPAPAPVVRAMENLKTALRLRFRRGPVDPAAAATIAAAIDAAAQAVETS